MPIDARSINAAIPLAGSDLRISDAVAQGRANKLNRESAELSLQQQRDAIAAQKLAQEVQRRRVVEFGSVVNGVKQLYPLLPHNEREVPRFMQALDARIAEIDSRGGDSSDSRMMRELAERGRFDQIRQSFDNMLHMERQLRAGELGVEALMPPEQPEAFTLGPGQKRFAPDGSEIASAPFKPEAGFTLGPGQTRYGPDGKPTASMPAAPQGPSEQDRFANRKQVRDVARNLRRDLGIDDVVGNFETFQSAIGRESGTGDTVAIITAAKILDPGSVVREGEQEVIRRSDGIFGQLQTALGQVRGGGQGLSGPARQELSALIGQRVQATANQYRSRAQTELQGFRGYVDDDFLSQQFSDPFQGLLQTQQAQRASQGENRVPMWNPQTGAFE